MNLWFGVGCTVGLYGFRMFVCGLTFVVLVMFAFAVVNPSILLCCWWLTCDCLYFSWLMVGLGFADFVFVLVMLIFVVALIEFGLLIWLFVVFEVCLFVFTFACFVFDLLVLYGFVLWFLFCWFLFCGHWRWFAGLHVFVADKR